MKITGALLLFFLSLLLFMGCSTPSYYIPAAAGNDGSYLPKPMQADSIAVKNYLSASISGSTLPYSTGNIDLGFINYSRGHTLSNLNVAYGAYGFAGQASYNVEYNKKDGNVDLNGKSIYGGGLRSSVGYYDNAGNAEFRILSWENSLSIESGGYAKFRKKMYDLNAENIISSKMNTLYTTGISTEIIWHSKRSIDRQYAFRLFYGKTIGLNNSLENSLANNHPKGGAFGSSFYFKFNKLFGIVDINTNKTTGGKLSLGYSF